jgi:hypothetical protein
MGIEQRIARIRETAAIPRASLEAKIALKTIGPLINLATKKLVQTTPKEFVPGFYQEYVKAIEDGCFPVFVVNHESQFDLQLLAWAANVLVNTANRVLPEEKKIKGTLVPMAQSVESGAQGLDTLIMYESTKKGLEKYKTVTILTATANDTNERGELPNPREFSENMRDGIRKGYAAIGVLPEGTKEGGRIGENGHRNGMQEFADNALRICISLAKSNHQPVVFIPIAISESWRVLDPQNNRPRSDALLKGFGIGNQRLASVKIGQPVRTDTGELARLISQRDWKNIDRYIGGLIAALLPFAERGKFK